MTRPKKYWYGNPTHCEVSGRPLNGVMYDCKIPGGPWAVVGDFYFKVAGCALGMGLGQRYEQQEDGRWLKTAG